MDGPLPRVRAGAPDHSLPTAAWTTAMRGCPQPLGQPRCAVAHTANSPDSSGLSLPDEDSAGRRRCRDDPTIWRRYRDDSASLPRRPEPPAEEQAQWSLVGGGKVVPCSWRLTLRLPNPNGLNDHNIIPSSLAEAQRLPRPSMSPPPRSPRRRRPNESPVMQSQPSHPSLIPENAPTMNGTGGINREHGHPFPERAEHQPKRLNEGRLPNPGNASHAKPNRTTGARKHQDG